MTSSRTEALELVGQTLALDGGAPRFRVDDLLSMGGQGWVYRGRDLKLGRDLALKLLRPDSLGDEFEERFRIECRMTAKLTSEHTVTLHDYGETQAHGRDFMMACFEYLDGEDLRRHVMRRGALTPDNVKAVLEQAASSLQEAHDSGFIHRDMKSENIMVLNGEDSRFKIKVLDFGIGKAIDAGNEWDGELTDDGRHMLTPQYAAPEQLEDNSKLGAHTDLYSLGVIAYWCLVGVHPYNHRADERGQISMTASILELVKQESIRLPPPFDRAPLADIIHKLLEKDISRRYAHCRDLLDDLKYLETRTSRLRREVEAENARLLASGQAPLGMGDATQRLDELDVPAQETTRPAAAVDASMATDRLPDGHIPSIIETRVERPHPTIEQSFDVARQAAQEFDQTRAIRSGLFDPLEDKRTDAFSAVSDDEIESFRAKRAQGHAQEPRLPRPVASPPAPLDAPRVGPSEPEPAPSVRPRVPEATEPMRPTPSTPAGDASARRKGAPGAGAIVALVLLIAGGALVAGYSSGAFAPAEPGPVSTSTSASGTPPTAVLVEQVVDASAESPNQPGGPDVVTAGVGTDEGIEDVDTEKTATRKAAERTERAPTRPAVEPVKSEAVASSRRPKADDSKGPTRKEDSKATRAEPKEPGARGRVVDSSGEGQERSKGKKTARAEPARETTPAPEPEREDATSAAAGTDDVPGNEPPATRQKIDLGFGGIN